MQTQGSLQESDLASLLQTMQSERATGTLALEDGSGSAALYFLFGHLFHASGPGGEGEDVVLDALAWQDGTFHFDPRAKLPAEETIKSSPAELIAAAEERQSAGGAGPAHPESEEAPSLRAIDGRPSPSDASAATDEAVAPESSAWSPAAVPAMAEAAAVYTPSEYSPANLPGGPAPIPEFPQPFGGAAGAATAGPGWTGFGSTHAVAVGRLPIPAGQVQYEGLKSAFVDFPRLLRTLRIERHNGYVQLLLHGASTGVLLFREGELIEAEAGDDGRAHGEDAFILLRREMDTGEGVIDVIELDVETVTAVARLLTGPPLFTGLLARFINFPELLEYLAEEKVDGSVIVAGGSQTGIILLNQGGVLAAYTAESRAPQDSTEAVDTLATERQAHVEVRGADGSRDGIDVEAALSRPY